MSAYVVAQLRFTDAVAYRRYQRRFADAFAAYQAISADRKAGAETIALLVQGL
jgi:uncharacterized protein (DUF1330 family)